MRDAITRQNSKSRGGGGMCKSYMYRLLIYRHEVVLLFDGSILPCCNVGFGWGQNAIEWYSMSV